VALLACRCSSGSGLQLFCHTMICTQLTLHAMVCMFFECVQCVMGRTQLVCNTLLDCFVCSILCAHQNMTHWCWSGFVP
jgi:hypothetical protein